MKVRGYTVKFGIFVLVMILVNAGLILVFGQMRGGDARSYSAEFVNASRAQSRRQGAHRGCAGRFCRLRRIRWESPCPREFQCGIRVTP